MASRTFEASLTCIVEFISLLAQARSLQSLDYLLAHLVKVLE